MPDKILSVATFGLIFMLPAVEFQLKLRCVTPLVLLEQ
jgi:hypothetical protein